MLLIVTRPLAQALPWVAALRALGQAAQALPLIDIAPPSDPVPVRAAWQQLASQALVMFVSANAVEHFFQARPAGLAWPAEVLAGSTGPGTTRALRVAGVPEAALVQPAADSPRLDSEALWAQLQEHDWLGRTALIVRGEDGRDWLADTLRARGAQVGFVAAYRRLRPQLDGQQETLLATALRAPAEYLWLFSSSEAVANLRSLRPQADWSASLALASHPRIAEAARGAGFASVAVVPPTPQAVLQWLLQARAYNPDRSDRDA
ncbi:MAG: uroporphyrinogen-III synthase [Rubrivivax sp.]|nr:uroporphyrinogen-III synthase [Rubrivivax sp.]